jgi:hypothetical protein
MSADRTLVFFLSHMASSKPKSSKPKSRARGKGKPQGPQTHQIQVNLTLDQKLDILGILLVALGGITVLSLPPSNKSDLSVGGWTG